MRRLVILGTVLSVAGCAMTPQYFYQNKEALSDSPVCRTWINALQQNAPVSFTFDVGSEAGRRGYSQEQCADKIAKENSVAAVVGVAALIGVAIAASRKGGGGGAVGASTSPPPQDYEWDWDEFYNVNRQLVWMCRGVQTGQFADPRQCSSKALVDWRWPSKEALMR